MSSNPFPRISKSKSTILKMLKRDLKVAKKWYFGDKDKILQQILAKVW
jgi:hypothetical protein